MTFTKYQDTLADRAEKAATHCLNCEVILHYPGDITVCRRCGSDRVVRYQAVLDPKGNPIAWDKERDLGEVEIRFGRGASEVGNIGARSARVTGMHGSGATVVRMKAGAPKEAFRTECEVYVDALGRAVPFVARDVASPQVGWFLGYFDAPRRPAQVTPEQAARNFAMAQAAAAQAEKEMEKVRARQREDARIKARVFVGEELDELIRKLES